MRRIEASSIGVLSPAVILSIVTIPIETRGQDHRGETLGTRSLSGLRPSTARPLTPAPFVNTAPLRPGGALFFEDDGLGSVVPSQADSGLADGWTPGQLSDGPAEARPSPRRLSLTAGFGNMFGGIGVSLERHLAGERLSVAVCFGGLPETDENPGTLAGAAAVRALRRAHATVPSPNCPSPSSPLVTVIWDSGGSRTSGATMGRAWLPAIITRRRAASPCSSLRAPAGRSGPIGSSPS